MTARKPKILCVDDEPKNLKLLDALLVQHGYDVITATNGSEALQKIAAQSIDVVLLDVMMPGLTGFDVCREIKENKKFRNIPVIMVTVLNAKQDRIKSIEAGAEEFLSKPFDQQEVLARIKMLLRVKELNDQLNYSYDNINRLTDFGEDIIKTFNPLEFDFIAKIDSVVGQILRQKSDIIERPEAILVRIPDQKNSYAWYRYEYVFDALDRTLLQLDVTLNMSSKEDSQLLFFNESPMESDLMKSFTLKLRDYNIHIRNMACYLSNDISIFALNYGREVSSYDAAVLNNIVMQTIFLRSLSSQVKETENAFEYTVQSLARASEVNDEDTGKHIIRTGLYCAMLAKKLKMEDDFVQAIRVQALLHDVGKIHTPSEILRKAGQLTPEELKIMQQHPLQGAKIIGDHPRLKMAKSIALTHHEKWDGSGYPRGLRGEDIPIESRIITVADQYDALRNPRVYKSPLDHKKTIEIIVTGDRRTRPEHFDPFVLKAFTEVAPKFNEIYETFKE